MSTKKTAYVAILSSVVTAFISLLILFAASRAMADDSNPASSLDPEAVAVSGSGENESLDPESQAQQLQSGPSQTIASPEDPDSPDATTRYIHVAGTAFIPYWDPVEPKYAGGGCVYYTGTYKYSTFPLELPYGSTVTQLRLYFKDTNANNGIIYLTQYDDGNSYTEIISTTTSGSSGVGYTSVSLSLPLDYVNYSYSLMWQANVGDASMQLCGARIAYTPPPFSEVAMPLVNK